MPSLFYRIIFFLKCQNASSPKIFPPPEHMPNGSGASFCRILHGQRTDALLFPAYCCTAIGLTANILPSYQLSAKNRFAPIKRIR